MNYQLYNEELNPKLWDKDKNGKFQLKKDVREALLRIAEDFVSDLKKDADVALKPVDIILVGSSVNYNWTDYSDLDLHIAADFSKMKYSAKDAANMFSALRSGWNKDHSISVKGLDVEVFVQDGVDSVDSDAIYSIKDDKWLKYPKVENPKFNKRIIVRKHKEFKRKIEALLKSDGEKTEGKLRKLLEKLYKYRQAGLNRGGEFSEENIVFKILRAQGYLDKIKSVVRKLYDKNRSLTENMIDEELIDDSIRLRYNDDTLDPEGIDVETDDRYKDDPDYIKTDNTSAKRWKKVYGIPIFAAYSVERGAERSEWMGSEVMTAIRHLIKNPHENDREKISKLIDLSVDRFLKQMGDANIDIIVPLGSKSKLNLTIAERLRSCLGNDIPILNDFIVKDIWKNVKVVDLGEKSKEGYNQALNVLNKMKSNHGDEPFEIKKAGAGQNLRRYFQFFYKTADGYDVNLTSRLQGANILFIDDTLEQGSTMKDAIRVLKSFNPKTIKGYVFLFGRYGGS